MIMINQSIFHGKERDTLLSPCWRRTRWCWEINSVHVYALATADINPIVHYIGDDIKSTSLHCNAIDTPIIKTPALFTKDLK